MDNPVNPSTAADPVVLLPLGEEVYQLIYDYNVAKAIARWTGMNPLMQTLYPCLEHPEGLEIALWSMLTQMGKKHDIPQDQRNIKREEVAEWCEDMGWLIEVAGPKLIECYQKNSPKRSKDEPPPDPNPLTQTATT